MTFRGMMRRFCAGVMLLGLSCTAFGSSLNVAPVRLELAPGQASGTVEVHNSGDRVAIMQARMFDWAQHADSRDTYEPTRALIVTPAVFSIAPGEKQVLRVGVRGANTDVATEQAYRLFLKEVPPADVAGGVGLRVALQINMPIFVLPAAKATSDGLWQATRLGTDSLRLTVENQGNAHLQITQLNLSAQGDALGLTDSAPSLMYVLPGQTQSWTLQTRKPLPSAGQSIEIKADTNRGSRKEQITLGS